MAGINVIYEWTVKSFVKQLMVYLVSLGVPLTTGAIVSYRNGDDAWWDQELPFPLEIPRFWPLATNTLYDWYTGLEWVADPSAIGGIWGTEGTPSTMSFDEAVAACNDLNYGGHNDWRLPNTKEAQTLVDFGKDHPALDTQKFKNSKDDDYFSGTVTNFGCENYFQGNGGTGGKTWDQDRDKKKYARPVRGNLVPWWQDSQKAYFDPLGQSRGRHFGK